VSDLEPLSKRRTSALKTLTIIQRALQTRLLQLGYVEEVLGNSNVGDRTDKILMSRNRIPVFLPRIHTSHAAYTSTVSLKQVMPMRGVGATAVAAVILFIVDQLLNAGRYSEVVADALIQVESIIGVRV
jgi:hypothetical protein